MDEATAVTPVTVDPTPSGDVAAEHKPYIRLGTLKDLDKMVDVACHAFNRDPVFNYMGNLKEFALDPSQQEWKDRALWTRFLHKGSFLLNARVTVVVDPAVKDADGEPKIVASAIWQPPKKRLAVWKVRLILRAGVVPILKRWKWTGFTRITDEYQDTAHKMAKECFKAKGIKKPDVDDSWYLVQMFFPCTGLMSLLMREAFEYAPNDVYTLEATTAASRDQYAHLGYELPIPIPLGQGKCDKDGLQAKGGEATGFEIWSMAKWPKEQEK
ncbi:hypothetical protein D9619_009072 [Psilocybe cf. subviscida]|uniref:N-acetyltransferase domain-containing protein n=1 Tax=Psilocybe cf. subviscida TaxID=2480587 RepID=A0A8H5FAJ5_9AGAR|nr:hypothetical protein D9619_009072 [Psilocybe cf. subviscida]